jgi:hypothetical protein
MIRAVWASLLIGLGVGEGFARPASPLYFTGVCDASAVEALNADLVAVADDEENSIRVYSYRLGGGAILVRDLSKFLKVDPRSPEVDLEGAARLYDRVYWISSHGRNAKGKARPSRAQFFATTATVTNGTVDLTPIGQPYHHLLLDFFREPRLAVFELWNAALLPPKSPGALNIEGLAATTNGQLLIGFRNPIPHGKALLVPLQNPSELPDLRPARFGEPILLDLQGLGIRSMTWFGDRFLIIAGRFDEGGKSRLFEWKGRDEPPRPLDNVDFLGLNPEAITCLPDSQREGQLFVTSDDGTLQIDGKPCKNLKDPEQKYFRALSLALTKAPL